MSQETEVIDISSVPSGSVFETEDKSMKVKETVKEPKKKMISKLMDDEEEEDIQDDDIEKEAKEDKEKEVERLKLTVKIEEEYKERLKNSNVIGVQALIGNYYSVVSMLNNQLGISSLLSLKSILKEIHMSSYAQIRYSPGSNQSEIEVKSELGLPVNGITKERLEQMFNQACDYIDNKEMEESERIFKNIFKLSIFYIATSEDDIDYITDLILSCTEYLIMIKLNEKADKSKGDKFLYSQICILLSICKLRKPIHRFLMLRRAKIAAKNVKNYVTAIGLIQKMLTYEKDLQEYDDLGFDKLLQEYNTIKDKGNDKDYPFNIKELENRKINEVLYAESLEFISNKDKVYVCPLCQSKFDGQWDKRICSICDLSCLGKEVVGVKYYDKNIR
jgi:rubrerythrin